MVRQYMMAAGLAAALVAGGCRVDDGTDGTGQTGQPMVEQPAPGQGQQQPQGELRLEVNLAARELYVYRGGQRTDTHPVAVGTTEWPTRTGEWTIDEVVFNPRWVPPDEEWAEDEDEIEPGDPENPLGTVQLVYDRPRSIHGTNEPDLIGQAVSHGSIRMRNEAAMQLARQVMEAGGAQGGEEAIRRAEQNRSSEQTVRLSRGIPISVR
jgi:L,D-transpeptidase ErfK/SrfK